MESTKFWNAPNAITLGRLFVSPIILVLMIFLDNAPANLEINQTVSLFSAGLFGLAMCSDMVDGWLARRYGLRSSFGDHMDPLADKMLFITVMIMMIPLNRLPAWIVTVFFIREVLITALRGVASDKGLVIPASHWGKYKQAFVSMACVGLLLHYPFGGIEWRLVGWVFLVPSFCFSIGSAIHYIIGFLRR